MTVVDVHGRACNKGVIKENKEKKKEGEVLKSVHAPRVNESRSEVINASMSS